MRKLIVLTPLFFSVFSVQAADLVNRDNRSYDIKVEDGGTLHSSISGNTQRMDICSSCRLVIDGVGEVQVSSSDYKIIIRNGSIERE